MILHEVEQRSPEWAVLRLGRLCGSRAAEALATIKSGEAAARRNLRTQLVLERLTKRSHENGYQSAAMLNGIEREGDALAAYEALTGNLVRRIGYVSHDELMAGTSPDGYIGEWEGLVEAKSPLAATHLEYLRTGKIPGDYYKQILHGLWLTGAEWCDWLSYHPDFPSPLNVKLVRVVRNSAEIMSYELLVRGFLTEVDRELATLEQLAGASV